MYQLLRSFLFLFPAERAHYLAMDLLAFAFRLPLIRNWLYRRFKRVQDPIDVAGVRFPNKIGLAAGFDKDAKWLHLLVALGFGHVEVGTVTPLAQSGNKKPRLFRLRKDRAIINRMGFNNAGVDAMLERLSKRPEGLIVGGNIGKNKNTPNEEASDDYAVCFDVLYPWVDYFTVNVSSPNTPGLRDLQDKRFLSEVSERLNNLRKDKVKDLGLNVKPIFLKIAPDLNDHQLLEIASLLREGCFEGVIATNTTLSRSNLLSSDNCVNNIGAGGLSGAPLFSRATEVVALLRKELPEDFPIIGVGGIMTPNDALEKVAAGAQLVQVYTGFIYAGPDLPVQISEALLKK